MEKEQTPHSCLKTSKPFKVFLDKRMRTCTTIVMMHSIPFFKHFLLLGCKRFGANERTRGGAISDDASCSKANKTLYKIILSKFPFFDFCRIRYKERIGRYFTFLSACLIRKRMQASSRYVKHLT